MGKEEAIIKQIEGLNDQRFRLVDMINDIDANSMNYFNKDNSITNAINTIDMQINQLIDNL